MMLTGCTIRTGIPRLYAGWIAGALLLTVWSVAWPQTLDVDPQLARLGSFSAQNMAGSAPNLGTTTMRVQSAEPWILYVRLAQPIRRVTDNLELPIERVRQYFPDLSDFCAYNPVRLESGTGGAREQILEYHWQLVEDRISQFLDPADPPGTYRFSVTVDLQGTEAVSRGHAVTMVMEFTVLPQVSVELVNPNFDCTVDPPGLPSESEPYYVLVRGNAPWVLEMQFGGELTRGDAGGELNRDRLMWQVGAGSDWESYLPAYTSVGSGAVVAARGASPPPFTLVEALIPLQFRVETASTTLAGIYGSEVKFTVRADPTAR
jgi:hypothetical protein